MRTYADLEISLHRWETDSYAVEVRFANPQSEADIRIARGDQAPVRIDSAQLRALELDPASYGRYLSECLFADSRVQSAFLQARTQAQTLSIPLCFRLSIGSNAPELHSLRWETLSDPQDGSSLLASDTVLFSRYLNSSDWRSVKLRPKGPLRALVVIANPSNVSAYQPDGRLLAPINVAEELARAKEGLGSILTDTLASGGSATLDALIERLNERQRAHSSYDILYLVAHGALIRGEPRIWLEHADGTAAVISGNDLVMRLKELKETPRLVVLISCESAGDGGWSADEGALAALGPRLAEAGIPAVLAMQGNISMRTTAQFVPVFFRELQQDGQIDRAVAVARRAVRDEPDWWMPVLFMRLRRGIWYTPGFAGEFERWPALLRHIQRGQCTPIIGPRVPEALLGSPQEIARSWAETYHFPMAPHEREELPQVAQYLAVKQEALFPHEELLEYLRKDLLQRYGRDLPDSLHDASLDEVFAAVGKQRRENDQSDPYKVLAELRCPVYITTNISNLLSEALIAAGTHPQVELCRWNDRIEWPPSIYDAEREPDYRPTVERPLVYHLFGHSKEPASLVLTEDDYFDYLIGVTRNQELIPPVVRRALTDTALLFLGFRIGDWAFRVLLRSIMSHGGSQRHKHYAHVAAQLEPDEDSVQDPESARRYLEAYFQGADINIFWGDVEDFVRELQARLSNTIANSSQREVGRRA